MAYIFSLISNPSVFRVIYTVRYFVDLKPVSNVLLNSGEHTMFDLSEWTKQTERDIWWARNNTYKD